MQSAVDLIPPTAPSPEVDQPWARRLTSPAAAALVLTLFWAGLLLSLRDKSATIDEPGHAAAGASYWKFHDYRLDNENGNLPQRWVALPLVLAGFEFPPTTSEGWHNAEMWTVGDQWFNTLGHDTTRMLRLGRAAAGLLAVALGAVVWAWSRQLFGPAGAMLSLLLYVLDPTVLANGALMKDDIAGALFFLLAAWRVWAVLHQCSARNVLLGSLAVAGLFVSKMSAFLLVPAAAIMIAVRLVERRPLAVTWWGNLTRRRAQVVAWSAAAVVHVAVTVLAVWALHGFRHGTFAPDQPEPRRHIRPWEWMLEQPSHRELLAALTLEPAQQERAAQILAAHEVTRDEWTYNTVDALAAIRQTVLNPAQAARLDQLRARPPTGFVARSIAWARDHRLLPEAYLFGLLHVWRLSQARTAFFNGEVRDHGWPAFFPFTFLVKTPLALFGVIAMAGVALWRTRRERAWWLVTCPLWALLAVYAVTAILSHLNIGHRHLLPVYPPLFVLCGAAAPGLATVSSRWLSALPAVLVAALGLETALRFPHYLAYFNGLVRPAEAYHYLTDSSLDWGQDLPGLARYIRERRPPPPYHLAFFGIGRPEFHGIEAKKIYGFPGYDRRRSPPVGLLIGITPSAAHPVVAHYLQEHPDYDPGLLFGTQVGDKPAAVLVKRASALRLAGGTYFISATLIQPSMPPLASGPWDAAKETRYQQLRATVAPLLVDDPETRGRALGRMNAFEWLKVFDQYDQFRFARLAAFLRTREPADLIHYTILVYRLSDADVARLLDGPPPFP
ncbi:MAG: glycosyltransferase family 39 protein [Verrucomicrobia bacterium]|nr:glycosyltransferase family 39 protein [Verrucomicrobiota bacterium]